jgi:hypothetical protein
MSFVAKWCKTTPSAESILQSLAVHKEQTLKMPRRIFRIDLRTKLCNYVCNFLFFSLPALASKDWQTPEV